MKKYLIIFLLIVVMGVGVYLLETFDVISLKAWGEGVITNTPFLKEYVQTNDAFQDISLKTSRLEEENALLISGNKDMKEEIEKLTEQINQQNEEIKSLTEELANLKSEKISDQKKLDKLIKIYSEMEAKDAAKILSTLNEELAIKLLRNLKEDNTASILTNLSPEKAAEFSLALEQ